MDHHRRNGQSHGYAPHRLAEPPRSPTMSFNNESSNDLTQPDYHYELLQSLERINTYNPPVHTCSTGWSHLGFYKGPISIALLFYRLSLLYPDLEFKGQSLFEWAEAYLELSKPVRHSDSRCGGIISHRLAHLTLGSIMTNDPSIIREVCSYVHELQVIQHRDGGVIAVWTSDGWHNGRAGYLYCLRLCRAHFEKQAGFRGVTAQITQTIEKVVDAILTRPVPDSRDVTDHTAAHGSLGIVTQIVLSRTHDHANGLEHMLQEVLGPQFLEADHATTRSPDPSARDLGAESHSTYRLGFARGASGIVISLESIKHHFSGELKERIQVAIDRSREFVWKCGLSTDLPSLENGIAGNALCFAELNDERFVAFLKQMTSHQLEKRGGMIDENGMNLDWMRDAGIRDEWVGLLTGEAGRAWIWAVADKGLSRRMIAYNDV